MDISTQEKKKTIKDIMSAMVYASSAQWYENKFYKYFTKNRTTVS